MSQVFETAEAALESPSYTEALHELLFRLADDDFLLAYRGSEWLGLAPHIEEDVAFSSISQDTMGHAAMYYELLEELRAGRADDLAHLRPASERKNSCLVELANGTGTYLENPHYDWAFAVVRHFFYDLYKMELCKVLQKTSYTPLQQVARKVASEQVFHLMHWRVWFRPLMKADGEAKTRMTAALQRFWSYSDELVSYGSQEVELVTHGLLPAQEEFKRRVLAVWESELTAVPQVSLEEVQKVTLDGRRGQHTEDLESALCTLRSVYETDPQTVW
ncbi:1,2-phenylacetyl-CoA epoxidase subunit PaaC [Bacillus fonticola]|uniref:1,2-phenylacetyl-CoA epoxidase subunit PaaC n=1 Tax=Bacillus fonticola TaxID=2728853 RepID=UPI0014745F76|nr:1,2-phenylacetyl-CoA epoxidase subunit PaaC [Bacillus fonticola]